jgi:hypothetical protein
MKNLLILSCLILAILVSNFAYAQAPAMPAVFGPHRWTAKIKVVGKDGNSIAGANVSVQYDVPTKPFSSQPTFGEVKGITDTNGMFTASHTDTSLGLGIIVQKPGYYATRAGQQFYYSEKNRHPTFTLLLKNIGKPIPMYAKQIVSITFPEFNKAIGYDLMAGDWVAPYGKGATTDILFSENHTNAQSGYTFTVSFPHPGDGIQGFTRNWKFGVSGLLSSHEAPLHGYQPKYEQTQMPNPNRIYYFRVRTVLGQNGHVKSALYGKIYGDFMQFTYYLDPTPNDRDVEFDVGHNLLPGLKSFEQVSQP